MKIYMVALLHRATINNMLVHMAGDGVQSIVDTG